MKIINRLSFFAALLALPIIYSTGFVASGVVGCGSGSLVDDTVDNTTVSTVAGSGDEGSADGSGYEATFDKPDGVTVTDEGEMYITDAGNHEVRKIEEDGTVSTTAGNGEAGYADGSAETAQFSSPDGITVDSNGDVLVADTGNNRIRKISTDGEVTTVAGSGDAGSSDGTGTDAQFNTPAGITVDSSDNLYVADEGNNVIRKITPEGVVTTFAGSGDATFQDGTATEAAFDEPHGIAVDMSDNIYVTDTGNNRVRQITAEAVVTTIAGDGTAGFANGAAESVKMDSPHGIGVDASGNVFFADENNNRIRKISTEGQVTTYAGDGTEASTDGQGASASFKKPRGVAVGWYARNEGVYVCDYGNNKIRKVKSNQ